MTDEMDFNKFFHSVASKLGAGTLEIVLVVAITANYFGYITINEPYYRYIIIFLFIQTLGIPFLSKDGNPKREEIGKCPYCELNYSTTGYECKNCGYVLPKLEPKSNK